MSLGLCGVVVVVALASLPFCEGFSEEHTIAWFNPHVSSLKFYDQTQIIAMVSQISTKFRILSSAWYSNDRSSQNIPTAVAKFNQLHKNPDNPPLELILSFRWNKIIDRVADSADKANLVFQKTVSTLLYHPKVFTEAGVTGNVSTIGASLTRNGRQYKLGVCLKIENCRVDDTTSHYLIPVLDHIDVIFFEWFPTTADYLKGAQHTCETLRNLATPCKEKMATLKPGLKVGFRTRWTSMGPSGVQNISEMALFWSLMNEFAESTGTFVIPSDAFDQVGVDTFGWWRLKDGSASSGNFVFLEKVANYSERFEPQMTPVEVDYPARTTTLPTTTNTSISNSTTIYSSTSALNNDDELMFVENSGIFRSPAYPASDSTEVPVSSVNMLTGSGGAFIVTGVIIATMTSGTLLVV